MMNFFRETLKADQGSRVTTNSHLLCEGALNHKIFRKENKKSMEVYVKSFNTCLNNIYKNNREEEIIRLLILIPQCPKDILSDEGERWMRLCAQNLHAANKNEVRSLLTIIACLLKSCHSNKELLNKVSKLHPDFLSLIYAVDIEFGEYVFNCLYEYLRLLPVQGLPHKKRIENRLMPLMALPLGTNDELVYSGSRVFAALPVPGGGTNMAEAKGAHLKQLISLSHGAADALFQDVSESETYDFSREHMLPILTLESALKLKEPIVRLLTSATVLGNCLTFLKGFLENSTFECISILPKDLISLVFRILQVELIILKKCKSVDLTALYFILPSVQLRAVNFLKTLVERNLCNLYLNLIEEQLVSTLKSTAHWERLTRSKNLLQKSHTSLRIACYEAISQVIKTSKGHHSGLLDSLIADLVEDTRPLTDAISLQASSKTGSISLLNVKKKSKKKGYTIASGSSNMTAEEYSAQLIAQSIPVTEAALGCIEALFQFAHHSMPQKLVRVLHDHLIDLLHARKAGIYNDPRVRARLFAAMSAYAMYPNPLCPPPYNLIYHFLQRGMEEGDRTVSETCMKSQAVLSFIMSNPNNTNWSDVTRLIKESKEVNLDDENENLPSTLMNGHSHENEMSEMSDDDNEMKEGEGEDEDEDEDEDEEQAEENGLQSHDEETMEQTTESVTEEEINENGDVEDDDDSPLNCDNEKNILSAENTNINEEEEVNNDNDNEEEEVNSDNDNEEEEEHKDDDSDVEQKDENEEDLDDDGEIVPNIEVGSKRQSSPNIKKSKRLKLDEDEDDDDDNENGMSTAVADMLSTFVDANPDSD